MRIAHLVKLEDTWDIRIAYSGVSCPTHWQYIEVHKILIDGKDITELRGDMIDKKPTNR